MVLESQEKFVSFKTYAVSLFPLRHNWMIQLVWPIRTQGKTRTGKNLKTRTSKNNFNQFSKRYLRSIDFTINGCSIQEGIVIEDFRRRYYWGNEDTYKHVI